MKMSKGMFNNLMLRGLLIALSAYAMIAFLTIPVKASTSNDLREYLGLPKLTESSSNIFNKDGLESGETSFELSEDDKVSENIIHSGKTYESNLDYFRKDQETLENGLITKLNRIDSAYLITTTIDNIIKDQEAISKLFNNKEYGRDTTNLIGNNTGNIDDEQTDLNLAIEKENENKNNNKNEKEQLSFALASPLAVQEKASIQTLDYNIGGIGQYAISPVSNYFRIVLPWGFNKASNEVEFSSKLLGIDLRAQVGDKILSQWNGIVVDISDDLSHRMKKVKIYHGNSTYTEYHHLDIAEGVVVGTVVKQGQLIGYAEDTSVYEPYLENHIFYQVKISGEYINPLLIFGSQGKRAYENWMTSTATENLIEIGEKYYSEEDYDRLKETHIDTSVIHVDSDFNTYRNSNNTDDYKEQPEY